MDISSFSDQHLAGQRLMIGFDGIRLDQDLCFMIKTLKIGGIVLFSRNLVDPDQIRQLTRDIQAYAEKYGLPPLFVSIDQEGGVVARLKPPFTQFPGNPHMKNVADAVRFAETTATELTGIGVNMDLAPVMDVAFEEIRSVMADRAFGHDPAWVSHLGKTVIDVLQERNVMAVAKHFPGIGRTELDSHMDLPRLDIDPEPFMETDIVPFQTAISANVAGVMLSHILYPTLDDKWPASLSGAIAKDLLRNRLGYEGVVMTDDLDMGAIQNHFGIEAAIDRILAADVDIAMICHRSPKIETAHERIMLNIKRSHENKERTVRSVSRIMRLKEKYL
jgi:beta-N-acetylhexosaminidase